ncbi:MAG TPA: hypothetical protein VD978_14425 [Azospirillum sp.]|nr:hypothetical protein [Azospirillum sp.]
MIIRNAVASALFSTVLIVSGGALAASQQNGLEPAFGNQLSETIAALRNHSPGGMGREERLTAEHYLQIAQDLSRQGQAAKAQAYLNFARGELGLTVSPGATVVTAVPFLSATKDFYNPNI